MKCCWVWGGKKLWIEPRCCIHYFYIWPYFSTCFGEAQRTVYVSDKHCEMILIYQELRGLVLDFPVRFWEYKIESESWVFSKSKLLVHQLLQVLTPTTLYLFCRSRISSRSDRWRSYVGILHYMSNDHILILLCFFTVSTCVFFAKITSLFKVKKKKTCHSIFLPLFRLATFGRFQGLQKFSYPYVFNVSVILYSCTFPFIWICERVIYGSYHSFRIYGWLFEQIPTSVIISCTILSFNLYAL